MCVPQGVCGMVCVCVCVCVCGVHVVYGVGVGALVDTYVCWLLGGAISRTRRCGPRRWRTVELLLLLSLMRSLATVKCCLQHHTHDVEHTARRHGICRVRLRSCWAQIGQCQCRRSWVSERAVCVGAPYAVHVELEVGVLYGGAPRTQQ
jgi:hypothetical protein